MTEDTETGDKPEMNHKGGGKRQAQIASVLS
jgi:hypothetical protein